MDKLISIDDERLWEILFDEACVEGQQADRIYKALKDIAKPAFDKENVLEELKNLADTSRKYWSQFDDEDAFGEMNAYTRAIEIVEKGGV